MDCLGIIEKFYKPDSSLYHILVDHSRKVTEKSLEIAKNVADQNLDLEFIENAAMLHDIGIFKTHAVSIGCKGEHPYVCHGYLGRELLDEIGLPQAYGLVCERHTGAGISRKNIIENNLPLPQRDMIPRTLEEKIICVADKYFSKSPKKQACVTTEQVIEELSQIHPEHANRFSLWAEELDL